MASWRLPGDLGLIEVILVMQSNMIIESGPDNSSVLICTS